MKEESLNLTEVWDQFEAMEKGSKIDIFKVMKKIPIS